MMKHKKVLALLLTVLVAVMCIAGCGNKEKKFITKEDYDAVSKDLAFMGVEEVEEAFGMKGIKDEETIKIFKEQHGQDVLVYKWAGPTETEGVNITFLKDDAGKWYANGITQNFKEE